MFLRHLSCYGVLSEGGGTRTHDLGIKSPLLYQLSYAPERRPDRCPKDTPIPHPPAKRPASSDGGSRQNSGSPVAVAANSRIRVATRFGPMTPQQYTTRAVVMPQVKTEMDGEIVAELEDGRRQGDRPGAQAHLSHSPLSRRASESGSGAISRVRASFTNARARELQSQPYLLSLVRLDGIRDRGLE
jgi:hypothetical protein